MKVFLIAVLSLFMFVACSQNAGKKEGTVASVPSAEQKPASNNKDVKVSSVKPLNSDKLIPEVAEKYSGVVISVIKKSDNSKSEVSVPFSARTAISGTPLAVEVLSLFPDFKMVDGGVANASMEEVNPGAKVKIYKDGKEAFSGWLFQNFPGMHGFDDPDFDVVMVRSVPKK